MPNKPSLVINTSPLVALAAALEDFNVLGETASLIVPGEVLAELEQGGSRDHTARLIRATALARPRLPPRLVPEK